MYLFEPFLNAPVCSISLSSVFLAESCVLSVGNLISLDFLPLLTKGLTTYKNIIFFPISIPDGKFRSQQSIPLW
jgi:hypothetical protein